MIAVTNSKSKIKIKRRESQKAGKMKRSWVDGFVMSSALVVYLALPSIVTLCFQLLESESVCGKYYVFLDEKTLYLGQQHLEAVLLLSVPGISLYGVLLPIGGLIYLSRQDRNDPSLMFRLGLFFSGYSKNRWWYEFVVILRKFMMIVVVTYSREDTMQLQYALLILALALHLQHTFRPFHIRRSEITATGGNHSDKSKGKRTSILARDAVHVTSTSSSNFGAGTLLLHWMELASVIVLFGTVWCATFFGTVAVCNSFWCDFLSLCVMLFNVLLVVTLFVFMCIHFNQRNNLVSSKNNFIRKVLSRKNIFSTKNSSNSNSKGTHKEVQMTSAVVNVAQGVHDERRADRLHKMLMKSGTLNEWTENELNTTVLTGGSGKGKEMKSDVEVGDDEWEAEIDAASGDTYYWNTKTDDVAWERPNKVSL